jgi:serine/threonine protein kinase
MIAFPCPACGAQLKVNDDLAGRMGKCPGCGGAVLVPAIPETRLAPTTIPPLVPNTVSGVPTAAYGEGVPTAPPDTLPTGGGTLPAPRSVEYPYLLLAPQAPDEIGRLGHYRVLKRLGVGGMGIVFRAEDSRLQRPVALKVMGPMLARQQELRVRFLREAKAMAKLDHPHVVPIYAVDECAGTTYIAMKLLQGKSLQDWLYACDGRLPLDEVLRIGEEVADALAAAHAREVIHRDVKPANIFIEAKTRNTVLIDFGLARDLEDRMRLTDKGQWIGTLGYMAPEQANGDEVDHRSDLFSLGCVLYRASTGLQPFDGQFQQDLLAAVRTVDPKPPRGIDPSLPPSFSELVMALLSKEPARRPQTALEARDSLTAIRACRPQTALEARDSLRAIRALEARDSLRANLATTLLLAVAFGALGILAFGLNLLLGRR